MKKDNYEYEFSVYRNIESDEIINNLCDIHTKRTKVKNKKSKEKLDLLHYYSKIWHACYVEWHDRKYDIIKNSMKRMNNSIFVIVNLNGKIICKILPFFIRDADIDFLRAVFAAVFILSIYRILQRINVVNSAFIDK